METRTGFVAIDELSNLTEKQWRVASRLARQRRAKKGWFNWHVNRGRLSLNPTKSELRRVSWRRAH